MTTLATRLTSWAHKHAPTRERLAESRWLHPLAARPHLWHFTRRSVPRGVAIGLLVGVFFVIPGLHIIVAALLCVPLRGNIPLAAGMTFLSNPATVPLIVAAALWIGSLFGFHADLATLHALRANGADFGDWEHWLLSDAAPALGIGLGLLSVTAASIGYFVAATLWRMRVIRHRRARLDRIAAERR
jgi:hypothetical protein